MDLRSKGGETYIPSLVRLCPGVDLGIYCRSSIGEKFVEPAGRPPELVATWRNSVTRMAPMQPLRVELLLDGGTLTGPAFEYRPGPLARLRRLWTGR